MAWAKRRPTLDGVNQMQRAKRSHQFRDHLLDALGASRGRPLFFFAHTYQAHEYRAEPDKLLQMGAAPDDVERLLNGVFFTRDGKPSPFVTPNQPEARRARLQADAELIYDAALLSADELVGDVMLALEQAGRLDDTWIIVTSDHGEALLERGELGHGKSVYDELVRIPLVIRGPGVKPGRLDDVVSLVDLAPTLRALCGLDLAVGGEAYQDGRSLVPGFSGERLEQRPALARGNTALATFRAASWPATQADRGRAAGAPAAHLPVRHVAGPGRVGGPGARTPPGRRTPGGAARRPGGGPGVLARRPVGGGHDARDDRHPQGPGLPGRRQAVKEPADAALRPALVGLVAREA